MNETVALGFPVLYDEGASFADGVRYTVAATIRGVPPTRMLTVEHCLTGDSYIREWIRSGDACFSTRLLFRKIAHREALRFEGMFDEAVDIVTAKQQIPIRFQGTPEVTCSIVTIRDRELIVSHPASGLADFWKEGERVEIPSQARIGRHAMLSFDDGSLSNLIRVVVEKSFDYGLMKTEIREHASDDEKPITLFCSRDIYDELEIFS